MSRIGGMAARRLLEMLADWYASDIPPENRQAFRDTFVTVVSGKLSDAFGGEQLRVYVPKETAEQRTARDERIAAALEAGETQRDIAKREKVTQKWVYNVNHRKLRGKIGGR